MTESTDYRLQLRDFVTEIILELKPEVTYQRTSENDYYIVDFKSFSLHFLYDDSYSSANMQLLELRTKGLFNPNIDIRSHSYISYYKTTEAFKYIKGQVDMKEDLRQQARAAKTQDQARKTLEALQKLVAKLKEAA